VGPRLALLALLAALGAAAPAVAGGPLYRDPVHDGAADATLVKDKAGWLMFYTNRRADMTALGDIAWVHGAHIGMAASKDGKAWSYAGEAKIPYGGPDATFWAPEIVTDGQTHHMFLTVVPGVFDSWNHPREIIHLTSPDLKAWTFVSKLDLGSDRVIDADVVKLPPGVSGGVWRMWFKDERDGSAIHYADSRDLLSWTVGGVAVPTRGEGPVVFRWKDRWWMIRDVWKGLEVLSSPDAMTWTAQEARLLETPGNAPTDRAKGQHPEVIVRGDRAFIVYFTHQSGEPEAVDDSKWQRRTVLHVSELRETDGALWVNRDLPATLDLR
jgi:hypothetical protein